ncbi:MAG: NAD(P)H-dependent flavin oxidoreductase [Planctomycetota bacterium]|jgi:enoyl-[acyl-carrier protein] reductase II
MDQNRICELLGIRYPIIQAPMNWVSGADLVAAVSEAGGLGTLGPNSGAKKITPDVELTGERMRDQIRKVRGLTRAPFAVNIVAGFGEDLKYSKKVVEVVIEEAVPVAIVSVGRPDTYTGILKEAGVKVLHAISTARHGRKAEEAGVDAVICEGFEAGGHKGFTELTTLILTPMVADAVSVPVVTGGGIGDARGVLAALALGADGIYMGTRFMVTRESESHTRVKEAIVRGQDTCTISVPKDRMLARDLANNFTREYMQMKLAGASPEELNNYLKQHSQYQAQQLGQADEAEICCGQVAGLITEVQSAGEVMNDVLENLSGCFEELKHRLAAFL